MDILRILVVAIFVVFLGLIGCDSAAPNEVSTPDVTESIASPHVLAKGQPDGVSCQGCHRHDPPKGSSKAHDAPRGYQCKKCHK